MAAVLVCFVAEDGQLVGPIPCDVSLTVTANDVAAAANDAVEPHSSGHAAIFCPLTYRTAANCNTRCAS